MNLRKIITLLSLILLFASCSKYQYFTISSHLPQEKNGSFLFENDSLKIGYSYTPDGHIRIDITNKLNKLIYVDWNKSSMIFHAQSFPLNDGISNFNATSYAGLSFTGLETSNISGTIASTPGRGYIPPKSRTSRLFYTVPIAYKNLKEVKSYKSIDTVYYDAKRYTFETEDSLHLHRSYIVLGDEEEHRTQSFNHSFWVSDITEALEGDLNIAANQFKVSKTTSTGVIVGTVGLAALIVFLVPEEE